MSILDTIRQNVKSLDDYAKLPQNILMSMAQKGQLPQDMLAPILARKSEMADAAAAMRAAAESRNAPQGSIIEQLMNKNAEAEQPRAPRDVGVAALPVRDDMYDERSFAGGGIVAFAGEDGSFVDSYGGDYFMPAEEADLNLSFEEKLRRLRERNLAPRRTAANEQRPLIARGMEAFGRGVDELGRRIGEFKPFGQQMRALQGRQGVDKTAGVYGGDVDMQKDYTPSRPVDAVKEQERANREAAAKTQTKATQKKEPVAEEKAPQRPLFEEYEKMLMAQGEDAKKAREEARNMRLLEAGLGIMGGTSPYALTNIGAGAIGAAKGYGQDIAGLRKEERERAKDLASIGMKREEVAVDREKLAMLDRRYREMADIERQKIGMLASQNRDEKTARLVNQAFNTLMSEYKTRLDKDEVKPSDLYLEAQRMVSLSLGQNIGGAGTMSTPNRGISFADFMSKK